METQDLRSHCAACGAPLGVPCRTIDDLGRPIIEHDRSGLPGRRTGYWFGEVRAVDWQVNAYVLRDLQPRNLNEYAAQCRNDNDKWWRDPETGLSLKERNKGELLMLMVSELSEALEGIRKNLQDDKLPHRSMEEVELADCLIRIFDYAGHYGLDLEGAYREKRAYNWTRHDHSLEARRQAGGKKF